ncbi:MAG: type II toxin-antitoxin system RelB/DinJ family antitoxin [Candidatus Ancillula sp.]|jgi:DNA-damage-inducible protein J|nr:type II toxin-antitoxin system RelB/DinJ family antitoxin [Candidatus Ancillula sp.]
MSTATITFRTDSGTKDYAEAMFANIGMNMSTAMNVLLKMAVREGGLPQEATHDPFWSQKNQKYLNDVINNIESGKTKMVTKSLSELEEFEK